jgi:hypothetical protein
MLVKVEGTIAVPSVAYPGAIRLGRALGSDSKDFTCVAGLTD